MCRLLRLRGARIQESKDQLAVSEESGVQIHAQWPEVRALALWARNTREQNHLTELFLSGRNPS